MPNQRKGVVKIEETHNALNNFSGLVAGMDKLCSLFAEYYSNFNLGPICTALDTLSKKIAEMQADGYVSSLSSASLLLDRLKKLMVYTEDVPDSEAVYVPQETLEAMQKLVEYIPEEKQEELQESTHTEPGQKGKFLTVDRIISLVALLLALITAIHEFAPDKNAAKSNQNEEIIIEKLDEVAESDKEQNELLRTLNDTEKHIINLLENLIDTVETGNNRIVELPDGFGPIHDGVLDFNDGIDSPPDNDQTDAQSQHDEAQD